MGKTAAKENLSRRQLLRLAARNKGETPDQTPIHVPGKSDMPLSLKEEMRRFIQTEIHKQTVDTQNGSFEDEDDFSEPDGEVDLLTQYTVTELVEEETPGYPLEPTDDSPQPELPPKGDEPPKPPDEPPVVPEAPENALLEPTNVPTP